ncbi:MAG: ABC transporter permease subunit [Paracoccaceae bacterium]|jgi:general L-amino acid transport system permease protein|nr:ABC transporter permease subunit [Paracoccaceae bacterium]
MASLPDANQGEFRLGMLFYDTRYRSLTIQVIFFMLFMAGAAWLVNNVIENLRILGKDFDFGFLTVRAGYDINQRLVEYSNDSTHARAMLIGLLNTLLLAFLACITATIVGILAGVLRLSKNWVVARLMTLYVETFRNVPLLLWILLVNAIMTESMPSPRDFRGADATASMMLNDSVAVTNRGIYVPEPLFTNSLGNIDIGIFLISIDLLAVLAAVYVGIYINRAVLRRATRIQHETGVRPTTWWQSVLLIAGIPLVLLALLGFHLGYPEMKGFNFSGGIHLRNSLLAMWIALTLYTGAFIAEIVRAGILAISRGQSEASFALGMQPGRTMQLVVLPQALRVIIPPLISQYLNITKNTSLALAVGYMDLRSTLGGTTINVTGRELEGMMLMMLVYLVISLIISGAMNFYNTRVQLRSR